MTARRNAPKAALEAIQEEATPEVDTSGPILVELVPGVTVRVLPPRMWRISGVKALKSGEFEDWAESSMATDEDFNTFCDVDPTLEQVEAFMVRLNEATEGNALASSTSSRRLRRMRKR